MSFDKALQEEQELEKEFLAQVNNQDQNDDDQDDSSINTDTEDTQESTDTSAEEDTTVITSEESKEDEEEPDTKKEKDKVSWKERFSKYKAATDRTISTLRRDNSILFKQLNEAGKKLSELEDKLERATSSSTDPYNGLISDEEADLIGPEAADIIKRAAKAISEKSTEPLAKEIQQLKSKQEELKQEETQRIKKAKYNNFLISLKDIVPDFAIVDKDPRFNAFMNAVDPLTGEPRIVDFKSAEEYYDVDRVSEFFLEFKRLVNAQAKNKVNLENNVTPVNSSNSNSRPIKTSQSPKITSAFIDKFFDDVSKGVYRNKQKEADRIEALINDAFIKGEIED